MNKIDILKTLESKGALKYPELKSLAGYKKEFKGDLALIVGKYVTLTVSEYS